VGLGLGLWLGLDSVSGWGVVMHTYYVLLYSRLQSSQWRGPNICRLMNAVWIKSGCLDDGHGVSALPQCSRSTTEQAQFFVHTVEKLDARSDVVHTRAHEKKCAELGKTVSRNFREIFRRWKVARNDFTPLHSTNHQL